MKAIAGKIETVGYEMEEPDEHGVMHKRKIRMIKVPMYFRMDEFPDALSFDGAELLVFRPGDPVPPQADDEKWAELFRLLDKQNAITLEIAKFVQELARKTPSEGRRGENKRTEGKL